MNQTARAASIAFQVTPGASGPLNQWAPMTRTSRATSGPGQISEGLRELWHTRLGALLPATLNAACQASLRSIHRCLEDEALEDGYSHPAEALLQTHLDRFGDEAVVAHVEHDSPPADFVRILGRSNGLRQETRRRIARWSLSSTDLDTRDAALQAIENWGDNSLVDLLRQHQEPADWLREYMQAIIANLSA